MAVSCHPTFFFYRWVSNSKDRTRIDLHAHEASKKEVHQPCRTISPTSIKYFSSPHGLFIHENDIFLGLCRKHKLRNNEAASCHPTLCHATLPRLVGIGKSGCAPGSIRASLPVERFPAASGCWWESSGLSDAHTACAHCRIYPASYHGLSPEALALPYDGPPDLVLTHCSPSSYCSPWSQWGETRPPFSQGTFSTRTSSGATSL